MCDNPLRRGTHPHCCPHMLCFPTPHPPLPPRGYECKEPEPGKLTLAFRALEDAVQWGCALQQELLGFAWPESGEAYQGGREVGQMALVAGAGAGGRAAGAAGAPPPARPHPVCFGVALLTSTAPLHPPPTPHPPPPWRRQCWSGASAARCARRRAPTCCGAACASRCGGAAGQWTVCSVPCCFRRGVVRLRPRGPRASSTGRFLLQSRPTHPGAPPPSPLAAGGHLVRRALLQGAPQHR